MTITRETCTGYGNGEWRGIAIRGWVQVHGSYMVERWDGERWVDTGWRRRWWIMNGLRREKVFRERV